VKLLKILFFITFLYIFSGCAQTIQNHTYLNNSGTTAKINIKRTNEPISMGVPYKIYDGKLLIGQLGPGGKLTWFRPEGQLQLSSPASVMKANFYNEGFVSMDVMDGMEYFYTIYANNTIIFHSSKSIDSQTENSWETNPNVSPRQMVKGRNDHINATMKGMHKSEVIAKLGAYSRKVEDGLGGEILVWIITKESSTSTEINPLYFYDLADDLIYESHQSGFHEEIQVFCNPDGIIYKATYDLREH